MKKYILPLLLLGLFSCSDKSAAPAGDSKDSTAVQTDETNAKGDNDDDGESSGKQYSEAEIDEALDQYERLTDRIADFYEKAAKGDQSALLELSGVVSEANQLDGKLQALKGEMNPRQTERLREMGFKLANASAKVASNAAGTASSAVSSAMSAADDIENFAGSLDDF